MDKAPESPSFASASVEKRGWRRSTLRWLKTYGFFIVTALLLIAVVFSIAKAMVDGVWSSSSGLKRRSQEIDPVTVTVTLSASECHGSAASMIGLSPDLKDIARSNVAEHTVTVSTTETRTQYVSQVPDPTALPQQASSVHGPYYYVGDNTSTVFLNGLTPTATSSLVTLTSVITVAPVSTLAVTPGDDLTTTRRRTSTSTSTSSVTVTPASEPGSASGVVSVAVDSLAAAESVSFSITTIWMTATSTHTVSVTQYVSTTTVYPSSSASFSQGNQGTDASANSGSADDLTTTIHRKSTSTELSTTIETDSASLTGHSFSGYGISGWNSTTSQTLTHKGSGAVTDYAVPTGTISGSGSSAKYGDGGHATGSVSSAAAASVSGNGSSIGGFVSTTTITLGSLSTAASSSRALNSTSRAPSNATGFDSTVTVTLSASSTATTSHSKGLNSTTVPSSHSATADAVSGTSSAVTNATSRSTPTAPSSSTTTTISGASPTSGNATFSSTLVHSNGSSVSIVASPLAPTTTSSTSAEAPTSTECGEVGKFTLDFDDLPLFAPIDNATAPFPPIFNPYHHLFFNDGFSFVPPPNVPFVPDSGSRLAAYVVEKNTTVKVTDGTAEPTATDGSWGFITTGPRAASNIFWYDAFAAEMGCQGAGSSACNVSVFGYTYSAAIADEKLVTTQIFTLPACDGLATCHVLPVTFGDQFRGLSSLRIRAVVDGKPVSWFMDDLQLGWNNSTCAAGIERASVL